MQFFTILKMSNYFKFILVFLACWSLNGVALGQTLAEKKAKADDLFKNMEWREAESLYASIIADDPKNHDLNFRYGTCLLNGSKNKEEAIRRLRYAVTGPGIDSRAFYYLGRAYHLNYQFNEAIKQYLKFKEVATAQDLKAIDVETDLKACNFGKKLLENITSMIVLEKTELKSDKFYDLYKLDDIGGTLIRTDEFESKLDKKLGHRPIIHFPKNSPYIYYSSYGEDGSTGLDIYVKKQLPGGEWSNAQKVQGQVNTSLDEDFAYMHPNGDYLYFCSKGHNSMGGYDVFRSRYNESTNSFGPPENLDFAISSPDDDVLFVVDSLDRTAYFASARESGQGNLIVYKVRVDRIPMQLAVIKGNFLNTIASDEKEVMIEIEDFSSGLVIGTFNSKQTNGDYLITFPKPGKYNYFITPKNSYITYTYTVDIPTTKEFKPLKQSMTMELDVNGEESITVTDLFDEDFEDPIAVLAEVYRELSKLDPNVQDFNIDSLDAIKVNDDVFVEVGLDAFITKEGLVDILKDEVEELENSIATDQQQASIAYNLATAKSEEANAKMVELNAALKLAEAISNEAERKKAMEQIIRDKKEVERFNNEAQSLVELAKNIDAAVALKEKDLTEAKQVLSEAQAIPTGDRAALADAVEKNKTYLVENIKAKTPVANTVTEIMRNGNDEQKEIQALSEEISSLTRARADLLAEQKRIEAQLANNPSKKDAEVLERSKLKNEGELELLDKEITSKTNLLDKKLKENETVRSGIAAAIVLKDNNLQFATDLSAADKNQIVASVKSNDLTENLALVDKVLEENKVSSFNIELYANSETTSRYTLQDWNDAISAERERLRLEKLGADAGRQAQIQAEIDRLERLREEKEASFQVADLDPSKIDPVVNRYELVPNYERRIESIDQIVNEADRRKAGMALNNEMIEALEKEKQALQAILLDDPKAKNVKQRLENVEELQENLVYQNKSDEEWLASNATNQVLTKDELISDLDPSYQQKINDAFTLEDEQARTNAIREANEILIEKASERIQELQAVVDNDDSNTKAKNELDALGDFVSDLTSNKDEALVDPVQFDVNSIQAEVVLNDLAKDFDARRTALSAIANETKRKEEENKLYAELIGGARKELAEMDRLAAENPGNKTIQKRQDELRAIEEEYSKLMDKNEDWLTKNSEAGTVVANQDVLATLNPTYQQEVDRIDGIEDEKEKNKAIEDLNVKTLSLVDQRLDEVNKELNKDPSNQNAKDEQEQLEALEESLKKNMSEALVEPTDPTEIAVLATRTDFMPDYAERDSEIKNSALSEEDKIDAQIALRKELNESIDEEIRRNEDLIKANPQNAAVLTDRVTNLKALQEDVEDEMDELIVQADGTETVPSRAPVSIESLMPAYQVDLAAIKNSNKSTREKLEEENELHQLLIGAIEWKIKSLEDEKASNPSIADQIDKEIQTLKDIKSQQDQLVETNKTSLENLADETDVADARPGVSVGDLIRDYDAQLIDIKNGSGTNAEKWAEENELNEKLIGRATSRIQELEAEKLANPSLAAVIDVEIEKLKDIKRKTQSSININADLIAQSGEERLERPAIKTGTLVEDYESRLAAINSSKGSETEKLNQRNELNAELIRAIDVRLIQTQEEWEDDPNNGFTYNEEINKLEELKESVKSDIARNREEIAELEADQIEVADLSPANFNTSEAKEVVAEFDSELAEIQEIDTEISQLEDQLNATDNEKDKDKIEKSITKLETAKANLENKVITGLEKANQAEIDATKENLELDQKMTGNKASTADLGLEDEIKQANENLVIADKKMREAEGLRNEADKEKDALVKNEKLTVAFELEQEAKELVKRAERIFKMARTGTSLAADDQEVVMDVPENEADRKSTALINDAAALKAEANDYYDRATFLRDSSESVKEKHRAPILEEASLAEANGDALARRADDLEEKGELLKAQEDELLAVQINSIEKGIDAKTAENVAATTAYKDYIEVKNEADKNEAEIAALQSEIDELKQVRTRKLKAAIVGNSDSPVNDITADDELESNQAKIDSLTALQLKLRDEALANYEKANAILNSQSQDMQENMMVLEQEYVKPYVKPLIPNVDFEVPNTLNADIFRTTSSSVYSDEARIPVGNKTSGLVYKVQVGAFRKPLPQDHFQEFAPISGEVLNNGITRYMVGYFTTFDPANGAKGKVNDLGYTDAFVVAYCNGERISIDKARQIEQGLIACNGNAANDAFVAATNTNTNNNSNNNANANNNGNNNANATNNTNTTTTNNNNTTTTTATYTDQSENLTIAATTAEERELTAYYNAVPNAAKANQVEIIKGLFYTVQIGVYSQPVPNSALFNIQHLNSQRTPTGFVRYSTGIFTSVEDATARKNEVVNIGITDAFVTAYFNGERITVEEALVVLTREGADALVGRPTTTSANTTNDNTENTEIEKFYPEGLYYRILLGKYEESIPGEYATLLLREDDLIETEVNEDGQTVVFSSKLNDYEEMVDRLSEFADLGVEDMEIITYYKYDVIPFEEGEKIRSGEEITEINPLGDLEGISANSYIYRKEAIYFKIKLGEFDDKVPTEFTNLLLLYEDEDGINKEETVNDEIVFCTGSFESFEEAEAKRKELISKGFDRAIIIAYHKYDEISIDKAREILGQ